MKQGISAGHSHSTILRCRHQDVCFCVPGAHCIHRHTPCGRRRLPVSPALSVEEAVRFFLSISIPRPAAPVLLLLRPRFFRVSTKAGHAGAGYGKAGQGKRRRVLRRSSRYAAWSRGLASVVPALEGIPHPTNGIISHPTHWFQRCLTIVPPTVSRADRKACQYTFQIILPSCKWFGMNGHLIHERRVRKLLVPRRINNLVILSAAPDKCIET